MNLLIAVLVALGVLFLAAKLGFALLEVLLFFGLVALIVWLLGGIDLPKWNRG